MERINQLKRKLEMLNVYVHNSYKSEPVFIADNNGVYAFEESYGKHFRIIKVSTLLEKGDKKDYHLAIEQLNKGCDYGKYDIVIVENVPVLSFCFNFWCNEEPSIKERAEMETLVLGCMSLAKVKLNLISGT